MVLAAHSRPGEESGLTLLEVLVAFVILAVAMTTVMQVFSTGLEGTRRAERANIAAALAEAKMAAVGVVIPARTGRHDGTEDNGYSWQVNIEPHREAGMGVTQPATEALHVRVEVRWPGARGATESLVLHSLRLAPAS
jgi:general secretion pathway protein I